MENLDVGHEQERAKDTLNEKETSLKEDDIINNSQPGDKENAVINENLESEEPFLKRKREPERNSEFFQNMNNNTNGHLKEDSSPKKKSDCTICNKIETNSKKTFKTCKMCSSKFHLDCLLSIGECNFSEAFLCKHCRKDLNMTMVKPVNMINNSTSLSGEPKIKTEEFRGCEAEANIDILNIPKLQNNFNNNSNASQMNNLNELFNSGMLANYFKSCNMKMGNSGNNNMGNMSSMPNMNMGYMNPIYNPSNMNPANMKTNTKPNTNQDQHDMQNQNNQNQLNQLINQFLNKNEKNESHLPQPSNLLQQLYMNLSLNNKRVNQNPLHNPTGINNPQTTTQFPNLNLNNNNNLPFNLGNMPNFPFLNKPNPNNVMNVNFINNLINCSNYQNIHNNSNITNQNSNPNSNANQNANSNKNLLFNAMAGQSGVNMNNFPQFLMSGVNPNINGNIKNTRMNAIDNIINPNNHMNSMNSMNPVKTMKTMNDNKHKTFNNMPQMNRLDNIITNNLSNPFNQLLTNTNTHISSNTHKSSNVVITQEPCKLYSIEDSLFLKNPDEYAIDIEMLERPELSPINIPDHLQNKIISIWDFFLTFKSALNLNLSSSQENFYQDLHVEKLFNNLNDTKNILFENFILSILPIFISYCCSIENIDFSNDKELLIIKTLKENMNTDINIILERCWLEIIRIIIDSKKFALLVDDKIEEISKNIKNTSDYYPCLEDKISILLFLINSAFDTPKIKEMINFEVSRKNELIRQKSQLETEYRNKEIRKREIERSDKFLNAAFRIDELSKRLEELENNTNSIAVNVHSKQKKDLEADRERYRSLIKENEDLFIVKENIIERLKIIKSELNKLNITTKRLLGLDLYKNEYFFFKGTFDKVYVKKVIVNENKKNNSYTWMCYKSLDDIQELTDKLLEKGNREKVLKRSMIKIVLKKFNTVKEAESVEQVREQGLEGQVEKQEQEIEDKMIIKEDLSNNNLKENVLMPAAEILKQIENKFSDYLGQYNKEWEDEQIREKWREVISNAKSSLFENFVQSLQMINLRFKNPYRNDEDPLSENEDEDIEMEERKTRPKFTFKINNNSQDLATNEELVIYEFDPLKVLAPKVKIWSKDLEINEMEKFYSEHTLSNLNNLSKFYLALHFYESVIFSQMKRRETVTKKNINMSKEITEREVIVNDVNNQIEENDYEENSVINKVKEIIEQAAVIADDNEKTVSCGPDAMDVDKDKTESVLASANSSVKKKPERKKQELNLKSNAPTNNKINKRNTVQKKLRMTEWRETCYICREYGDLICCDGCTNVAHQFCACLEKMPLQWYCVICEDKTNKIIKKK